MKRAIGIGLIIVGVGITGLFFKAMLDANGALGILIPGAILLISCLILSGVRLLERKASNEVEVKN